MVRTKRSAGKRLRTTVSPSPPPPDFNPDFPSPRAFQVFESSFSKREVLPGRLFDFDTLEQGSFEYISTLRSRKWKALLELSTPVLLDSVRAFYSNAQCSYDGHEYTDQFKTFLQNTEIEITPEALGQFLQIRSEGEVYTAHRFDALAACQTISNDPSISKPFKKLNHLSVDIRIMHLIICQVLSPRKGNYAQLYPEDLWYLEKIVKKESVNLPKMICAKMVSARARKSQALPYGCLISAFIKSKFNHIQSSSILPSSKIPVFNHTSLLKMGYVFDQARSKYVKVRSSSRDFFEDEYPEDEEDEEEEPAGPSQHPPQEAGSSSQVTPDVISSLQIYITAGFTNMARKFEESFASHQAAVTAQVSSIQDQVSALSKVVESNHRQHKEHLDSLQEQIGNLELLVLDRNNDSSESPDSPAV